jgi:hypothetical protein
MHSKRIFSRVSLGVLAATVGLVAASWAVAPAAAEPQRDDAAHKQLCADLYLIYDTNMDTYYDKSKSAAERQQAYDSAHKALSDYRKQGCKGAAISRAQEVLTSTSPTVNVQDASVGALPGRIGAATTATHAAQLVSSE